MCFKASHDTFGCASLWFSAQDKQERRQKLSKHLHNKAHDGQRQPIRRHFPRQSAGDHVLNTAEGYLLPPPSHQALAGQQQQKVHPEKSNLARACVKNTRERCMWHWRVTTATTTKNSRNRRSQFSSFQLRLLTKDVPGKRGGSPSFITFVTLPQRTLLELYPRKSCSPFLINLASTRAVREPAHTHTHTFLSRDRF